MRALQVVERTGSGDSDDSDASPGRVRSAIDVHRVPVMRCAPSEAGTAFSSTAVVVSTALTSWASRFARHAARRDHDAAAERGRVDEIEGTACASAGWVC